MATQNCDCSGKTKNTGRPDCTREFRQARVLFWQEQFDSEGVENFIDLTSVDNATISALINQTDESKRLFPIGNFDNVEILRGDDINQSLASGVERFVHEGQRTFLGSILGASPQYLDKLQDKLCKKGQFYIADINGNFIGKKKTGLPNNLFGIGVEEGTFRPKFIWPTDDAAQEVMLTFTWDIKENDADVIFIPAKASEVDFLTLRGLLDIFCEIVAGSITQTGFKTKLTTCFGDALVLDPLTSLVLADVTLFNDTDVSPVTVTGLTQSPDGTYAWAFASQDVSDVLDPSASKVGFDFAELNDKLVTVV